MVLAGYCFVRHLLRGWLDGMYAGTVAGHCMEVSCALVEAAGATVVVD